MTEEELKTQFSKFGEITSLVLKAPVKKESPAGVKFPETQFAFINYKTSDEARNALTNASKDVDVINLFEAINGKAPYVFVTFHMKRSHFDLYRSSQKRQMMPMMMPYPGAAGGFPGGGRPPFMQGGPQQGPGGYQGPRGQYGGRPRGGPRRGGPRGGGPGRGHHHAQPQVEKGEAKNVFESGNLSIALLKENMAEFTSFDQGKQRNILGELLFPMVEKLVPDNQNNLAPKVTGMLIDLEVFEITEIIEFIEDQDSLKERVTEAVELLNNE